MRVKYPGSARAYMRRLDKYGSDARPDPGWKPSREVREEHSEVPIGYEVTEETIVPMSFIGAFISWLTGDTKKV